MPAYFDRGFAVRQPMWHGLGTILADYPGREQGMKLAGHDFDVICRPMFAYEPDVADYRPVDGWKALLRSDTRKVIACQREGYEVVQNRTLWDIVDAIVDQPNVRYETAGVLNGGTCLWVMAWLNEPTIIKGDDSATYPFVLVSTTHDGSGACKAAAINIRVVCYNTFSAANMQSKSTGLEYTFRHTKNVAGRMEDAKAALRGTRVAHSAFIDLCNELADLPVSVEGRKHFLAQFIPEPKEMVCTDRVRQNISDARNAVVQVLERGRTIADPHRGTAIGLFHAGIEYLDHLRGYRNSESYFRRSLMSNEAQKRALIKLVRESAAL